jgi:hypothetical protein
VTEQVPEGPELDYKLRPYDDTRKTKEQRDDELRKDVTALANAVGGVIVCGISDQDGVPWGRRALRQAVSAEQVSDDAACPRVSAGLALVTP